MKILITLFLLFNFLNANSIYENSLTQWFSDKYEDYLPYLKRIDIEEYYNEAVIISKIYILNKKQEKTRMQIITFNYEIGTDYLLHSKCLPEIEHMNIIKSYEKKEMFKVSLKDVKFCKNRLSFKGQKKFIEKYIEFLERYLLNAIDKSYNRSVLDLKEELKIK